MNDRIHLCKVCLVFLCMLLFSAGLCEQLPHLTVYETYLYRVDRTPERITLWFEDGRETVPLVDVRLLQTVYPDKGFEYRDGRLWCSVDEGYFVLDTTENRIVQHGFDVTVPLREGSAPTLYMTEITRVPGRDVTFDLKRYDYILIPAGDSVLIPVVVLSALVVEAYNDTLFSDGESLYYGTIHDFATETYKAKFDRQILPILRRGPWRTPVEGAAFAKASYNALCFRMDYVYGYRERWPDGFDAYLQQNWPHVRAQMLTGDPYDVIEATNDIVLYCVNDIHTSTGDLPPWFMKLSRQKQAAYLPKDGAYEKSRVLDRESRWSEYTRLRAGRISGARANRRYEGVRFYKELAILSWDEFTMDMKWWAKYSIGDDITVKDTPGFLYRAFKRIERHPEIRYIVMDLTCNYGGITDGGLLAMGFMKRSFHAELHSGLTGAVRYEHYRVDTNLDGTADEKDSYEGRYSFYILISDASFSCGNLLPAMAKEQGAATILGMKSAGGGCSLYVMKDLYGTTLGYSGTWAGYTRDAAGNMISNDLGVVPDKPVDSSCWYNDAKLYKVILEVEQNK